MTAAAGPGALPHFLVWSRGLRFKSLMKEPVLHFLLIGLLLFVAYGRLAPR